MMFKIKVLSSTIVILLCFLLVFNGCKKSILIPENEATIALSFELPVIANEQEINNKKSISLNELLKEPSVKAITLHFCMIDDISTGWTYKEVYEQNKSKGLISLMIINYPTTVVNQLNKEKDAFKFIRELINETNTTMPILQDSNEEVRGLYKASASPYIFLIDKSGKIRYSRAGYQQEFVKEFNQALGELLSLDTIKTSEGIHLNITAKSNLN